MSAAFDPDAPEDRRSSQYVSRRDVRVVGVVLIVLAASAWPIYMFMLRGMHESVCKKHLRRIGTAIGNYTVDFDEHLPYAYETLGYDSSEIRPRNGMAYTWHWPLMAYMKEDEVNDVFTCPAAGDEENTKVTDGSKIVSVSYGMLNAYSGVDFGTVANPGQKFLISETIRNGNLESYDPLPFPGVGVNDGFVIGFDNDQTYPDKETKYATRLAYPTSWEDHSGSPSFRKDTPSRHPGGVNFLLLDGSARTLDATAARVNWPDGPYEVPRPRLPFSQTPPKP
jgi:prepilin-type processing-associated H-X9-DG protein